MNAAENRAERAEARRPLRVLFIVTAYPRHGEDVITPWMGEAIAQLARVDVDVEVLAPSYRGSGSQQIGGVRVHRFRYAPRNIEDLTHDQTAPDRIREQPVYLGLVPSYVAAGSLAALRLARTRRFDVLHAFWPIPHSLFGLAARAAFGTPLVSSFFGAELSWIGKDLPFLGPLVERIVAQSDAVTTNSLHTARLLARYTGARRPPQVVPFGVAVEPPAVHGPYRPDPTRPFRALFIGRLVERKGMHRLLAAIDRLQERRIHLHVLGDGPERPALERRARELGVRELVTFHGFVSPAEKSAHLAACDALVLPAVIDAKGDTEGQGVVLLEAMAFAKPVIASRVGGIVEAVDDEQSGFLVPPDDPIALADAIARCMDDPARAEAMGQNGLAAVQSRFSWTAICGDLRAVYDRVTGGAT